MSKYYSINKFSKILGVSAQTNIILPVMDIDIIRMDKKL